MQCSILNPRLAPRSPPPSPPLYCSSVSSTFSHARTHTCTPATRHIACAGARMHLDSDSDDEVLPTKKTIFRSGVMWVKGGEGWVLMLCLCARCGWGHHDSRINDRHMLMGGLRSGVGADRERNFRSMSQRAGSRTMDARSYPRMDSMGVHEARLPRVPSSMALLEHVLCMDTCFIYIIWLHANRPISDKK